jgi:type II secretory pathway predicted ATPase ExeA
VAEETGTTGQRGYERYGLTGNPFRDLVSESLDDVEIYHVRQAMDEVIRAAKEEVIEKENKAVIAILGALGMGKTERLLLAQSQARKAGIFAVFRDLTSTSSASLEGIIDSISEQAKLGFGAKISPPKWVRDLNKQKKALKGDYDAEAVGKAIAEALNENAPAFLMLNDLQDIHAGDEETKFTKALESIGNYTKPGVLVLLASDPHRFQQMVSRQPSLSARINRSLHVAPLSDQEASLLIAKRLLSKRLVEDLEPIYPFTPDGIAVINQAANGNPREVIRLSDQLIEFAARRKSIQVDAELVQKGLDEIGAGAGSAPATSPARPTARAPAPPRVAPAAPAAKSTDEDDEDFDKLLAEESGEPAKPGPSPVRQVRKVRTSAPNSGSALTQYPAAGKSADSAVGSEEGPGVTPQADAAARSRTRPPAGDAQQN